MLRHPIYKYLDYYLDLNPDINLNSEEVKSHLNYFILGVISFSKFNLTQIENEGIIFRISMIEF